MEDDRELVSAERTNTPPPPTSSPPTLQSAAHLAGFMGRELTSGRLPSYPSSVWKLIPSSVSRPRDPSAGDLTWVSAVCVTPTLPPVYPRERKLRRPPRLRDPRRSRRGDGSSQIFLDSRIGLVLHLCLVSFLSNFSPPPMVTFFTCRHPPPSPKPLPASIRRLRPPLSFVAHLDRFASPPQLPACRLGRWRSEPPVGAVKHYLPLSVCCRRRAAEL